MLIPWNNVIKNKSPDNIILVEGDEIYQTTSMYFDNNEGLKLKVLKWYILKPLYEYPQHFPLQKAWELKINPCNDIKIISINKFRCKLQKFKLSLHEGGEERIFVIPLLH